MSEFIPKLKNWWWYHRFHVLIALAALAVLIYSFLPAGEEIDHHVALVSARPHSEQELIALEQALALYGQDVNGDGEVLVRLHFYPFDPADEDPNAGSKNYQFVAALDGDLVGHTSDLFLLDDAQSFQRITDGLLDDGLRSFQGMQTGIRKDASPEQRAFFENIP